MWLSDEVIHAYLRLLFQRFSSSHPTAPPCAYFKSFFMTSLMQEGHTDVSLRGTYNHSRVQRWPRRVDSQSDIFRLHKLFIPINVDQGHWIHAFISFPHRTVTVYDSMGSPGYYHLAILRRYLHDEHQLRRGAPLPLDWRFIPCPLHTPRQPNSFDCGVYTCSFVDRLLRDLPLTVTPADIARYRGWMAAGLLAGSLPAV